MQFVSTVSSFLHIMIRHNVDFCKNEPRFMPLKTFHLNCILLLMMKMNKKQFLFHSWKIRAEGRSPLNIGPTTLWCGQNMNELRNLSLAGWNFCLFCTTMKSCQLSLKKKHLSQCLLFSFVLFLFFSNESSIHMYATNWRFFFCICKLFTACCTQKMYVDMRLIHVNIQDNHIFTCLSCRYQFLFHMQTPISLICKMQYMFK